jgi:hypothetical protein
MTAWGDVRDEMRRMPVDPRTADRLLTGRMDPDDAPPGYAGAARLLQTARAEAAPAELRKEPETIAAMAAIRLRPAGHAGVVRRRTMTRSLKLKIGASALVAALMGSTGLAVAGALPGPAQTAAAHVLARIGVSVPGSGHTQPHSAPSEKGKGPDATGPEKFGLCTAFASGQGGINGGKNDAVAFRNLQAAAGSAGQSVEEFCADVTPGGGASNGHSGGAANPGSKGAGERGTAIADSKGAGRSGNGR